MDLNGKRIILGSASPRRKELLRGLDIEFEVETGNSFREDFKNIESAREIPVLMSEGKSRGFHRKLEENEILITADTIVICGGRIFGKPADRAEAVSMLKTLAGKTHEVITSVTIRSCSEKDTFSDTASVRFGDLDDEEIDYYIDRYRPYDKAGSYGVQEWIGYVGIERIEGSFYTIMGFPVYEVYRHLRKFISSGGKD